MKTIWDAVNELGGEWKFKSEYICAASSKNKSYKEGMIRESHTADVNDFHYYICSKAEFNALVAEMSLGLDVNPVNEECYHKYLAANKDAIEPIKQKPIYTQEMCDNGELPSVGMSFLCGQEMESDVRIAEFSGEEVIVVGINKKGDRDIITFYHTYLGFGCGIFFSSWVNPITPKLDLIDGEAYQYNCDNSTHNGIYDEFKKSMYSVHSITCIDHCTNIKPLTASD